MLSSTAEASPPKRQRRAAASAGTAPAPSPGAACEESVQKLAVSTGNVMLDQFKSTYFGVAFAFVF
eukprot:7249644-Heterocapsa_arctica.AAC.1